MTVPSRRVLPRSFFQRPVLDVAPDLLGRHLVHRGPQGRVVLRLTEVEAYDGVGDPGAHTFRGRTARNATMFGPPGHVYVYFTYGMHHCMNLVCGPEGYGAGVLIRAAEVVAGVDLVRARRTAARRDRELASGPARLTVALDVDLSYDGADACSPHAPFRVLHGTPPPAETVRTGPRTGVSGAGAVHPWRFWIDGDVTVSPYRAHVPRKRAARAEPRRPACPVTLAAKRPREPVGVRVSASGRL